MVHRIALFAASLAASALLVVGLALAGLAPAPASVPPVVAPIQDVSASTGAPSGPVVQVDTVYVAPPVKPVDVTITKVAKAALHGDDGNESGGDD